MSTGPTCSHACGDRDVEPVVRSSDSTSYPSRSSRARIARPDAPLAAGDERLHGSSTTLPTWRRDSISACASRASASGNVARRADRSAPAPTSRAAPTRARARARAAAAAAVRGRRRTTETLRPTSHCDARVLPETAGESDRDDRAERIQQRQRPREHLAADRVERRRRRAGRRSRRSRRASSAPTLPRHLALLRRELAVAIHVAPRCFAS